MSRSRLFVSTNLVWSTSPTFFYAATSPHAHGIVSIDSGRKPTTLSANNPSTTLLPTLSTTMMFNTFCAWCVQTVTVIGLFSHLGHPFFLCFSSSFCLSSASRHQSPFSAVSTLRQGTAPNWLPHVWVAIKTRHDTFLIHDVIGLDPSISFWMLCNHSAEWCLFFSSFLSTIMWSFSLMLLCLWLVTSFPFLYGSVSLYKPVEYFMYRNLILGPNHHHLCLRPLSALRAYWVAHRLQSSLLPDTNPDWFLDEFLHLLKTNHFISIHYTTIHRQLECANVSCKKLLCIAAK